MPFEDQSIRILSIKHDLPTPGAPVTAIEDHESVLDSAKIEENSVFI
jgi:hypothetical protein